MHLQAWDPYYFSPFGVETKPCWAKLLSFFRCFSFPLLFYFENFVSQFNSVAVHGYHNGNRVNSMINLVRRIPFKRNCLQTTRD